MLEYWSGASTGYGFPDTIKWENKMETDLDVFARVKQPPKVLAISPTGNFFATFSRDGSLKIFSITSGKLIKELDESLTRYINEAKLNE